MNYLDQLKSVPSDSVIYTIWGWTGPQQTGGKKLKIGDLKLNGKLHTSKWGDEIMYFRHQKMDMDIKG